jgi:hypothetical protein
MDDKLKDLIAGATANVQANIAITPLLTATFVRPVHLVARG